VAYLGGILTIISPCILPVLPFVFARADRPFIKSGLPMLIGMAVTFAAIATLATMAVARPYWFASTAQPPATTVLAAFGLTLIFASLADRDHETVRQFRRQASQSVECG
jgi:cytochrome c biogenesis protein CcdA